MTDTLREARELARDIMDEACLGEAYVLNGIDSALRKSIEAALQSSYDRGVQDAHKCVKVIADDVRANARNPMEHAVANAIATAAQAILRRGPSQ
jgi:hypothetical protein